MKRILILSGILILGLSFSPDKKTAQIANGIDSLKLNQIQIIATHNSYHIKTDHAVFRFLTFLRGIGALPGDLDPKGIDYTKDPLTDQLEKYGVRGLELDIWNDPEGGKFYFRKGKAYVFKSQASHVEALKKPGFKILHIPDFDFNTTNYTLIDALTEIKKWSDAHPRHLPVFINIETETAAPGDIIHAIHDLVKAAPFDSIAFANLDAEVKSVFGENLNGVITPDNVRGNYKTLEEAALNNWPTVENARGKVIFIIDGNGSVYEKGRPSLEGRTMFVYSQPGTPAAAFVILNDPNTDYDQIQKRVQQGYIVRTRADDGTVEARTGNYAQMNKAFASWAQIISTDYPKPDPRAGTKKWSNYKVQFPNAQIARIDSISAINIKTTETIEEQILEK